MSAPLAHLKVLDFSAMLPGPYASMVLADLGADVVRVEAPQRPDLLRFFPPSEDRAASYHALINRSKRSLALDLKAEGAVDIVQRLVETYDIVLEGFRPGVMARLGVGYPQLRQANPALIFCSISGYGQSGPLRQRAGHDLNYSALSGVAAISGRRAGGPLPLPIQLADLCAGAQNAVIAILAAVIERDRHGEGQHLDVAMFDGMLALNALAASQVLVGGSEPGAEAMLLNGGMYYDYYQTLDGRYLAVACLEPHFWEGFCSAIGRDDLTPDGYDLDPRRQQALKGEIQRTLGERTLADWMAVFAALDVCVEPVLSVSESLAHPQTAARQMIVEVPLPEGGAQRQVGSALRFAGQPSTYRGIGPELGEHSAELLRQVGYSAEEVRDLIARQVVHQAS